MDDLIAALLLERYGPPPVRELRRPARPRMPWSPATLHQIAERRRVLLDALEDIDQDFRRGAA